MNMPLSADLGSLRVCLPELRILHLKLKNGTNDLYYSKKRGVMAMLIEFSFENYKSFKEKAVLDLSAAKMSKFADRVILSGNERLLPAAAIYGANASGKSNVYSAFAYMTEYVIDSFQYGGEEEHFKAVRPAPFLFADETENADTGFEVYFTIPDDKPERVFHYGFSIGNEGVTEEWLNSKVSTAKDFTKVFYRDSDVLDLEGLPKNCRENIKVALEPQVLIVSLGAKLKVDQCIQIRDWFMQNGFADYDSLTAGFKIQNRLPKGFAEDPAVRADVVKYIASFDETIKGFRVEKVSSETGMGHEDPYQISTIHRKINSDKMVEIPLEEESAGTLKMLALYTELQKVLKNGGVYFVDGLDSRLHPLLVRNLIVTFLNPEVNTKHAQLIFTTHDTWLLSSKLLRRDEIWFTEKDENGVSALYSLADFVEEGKSEACPVENYEVGYLSGKYGAIPSLKGMICNGQG